MTAERFGQAYSKGFELTTRLLISRGLQREEACELAQAAWVRGLERLGQLRDDRFVLTWVNTIALNFQRKLARTNKMSRPVEDFNDFISTRQTTSIDLAAIDMARALSRCSPSVRNLLSQQMSGVTSTEIALERGLTPTAVRIRLMRARREARSRMEKAHTN